MNKRIAFNNRLCYERDVARQQAIHREKLRTILPTCKSPSKKMMDSEPNPFHSIHFGNNPKKRQMEKERAESIYLANQRLAKKMHHILHRKENKTLAAAADGSNSPCLPPASPSAQEQQIPPPSSSSSSTRPARVHMPGIRLDATQMPIIDCHLAPEVAIGRGVACRKESLLNQGIEKRRRQKIERENKRMKQRIASQKPFYNAKKWDQEWEETVEKFSHLHHDGTVGYLPPKTPMTSCGGRMKSPLKEHTQELEEALDSPTVSYNIKSQSTASSTDSIHTHAPKKALPLLASRGARFKAKASKTGNIRATTSYGKRDLSPLKKRTPRPSTSGKSLEEEEEEEYDDEEEQRVIFGSSLLMEAKTAKGIEISIEEHQIEMTKPPFNSSTTMGDRGILVSAQYQEYLGEYHVSLPVLEKVAQNLNDLEMLIKFQTINTFTMGNFPRLTNVLSEEELKSLLLKLVRSIKIEQNEQTRTLQLISSFDNRHTSHGKKKTSKNNATKTKAKPHGTTDLGNAQDDSSKSIARPHTCPETVLSSSSLSKATAKERASKTPFVPSKIRSGESKSNDTSTTVPPTLSTHRTQILDISIIQKNMKKFARILKGTKAHNQTQRGKIRWTSNILNTTSSVVYLLYQFSFDTEWQIFNLKIFNMSSNSFHEYSYEYSEQEILSHMRSIEQHKETKETLRQKIVERHIQALMTRLVVFS